MFFKVDPGVDLILRLIFGLIVFFWVDPRVGQPGQLLDQPTGLTNNTRNFLNKN